MSDVLIVDANSAIRSMFVAGLSGFGFSVTEADSYSLAIEQLEAGDIPHVAIVDFTRDDESAQSFIERLRDTPAYQSTKVIITTVNSLSTEEQNALGVDAIMVKPVELAQLVKAVYLFRRPSGKNDK